MVPPWTPKVEISAALSEKFAAIVPSRIMKFGSPPVDETVVPVNSHVPVPTF